MESKYKKVRWKSKRRNVNGHRIGNDPLVVRTEDLAAILLPIIHEKDAEKERHRTTADYERDTWAPSTSDSKLFQTGRQFIADKVGVGVEVVERTLFHQDWVGYGKADAWLCALDLPHLADELRPVPNPRWSQELWARWAQETGHC